MQGRSYDKSVNTRNARAKDCELEQCHPDIPSDRTAPCRPEGALIHDLTGSKEPTTNMTELSFPYIIILLNSVLLFQLTLGSQDF